MHWLILPIALGIVLIWLILCIGVAVFGFILPKTLRKMEPGESHPFPTICKTLLSKGLMTEEDYQFEVHVVAPQYDTYTFNGYLFLVIPVKWFLANTKSLDQIVVYLVGLWMEEHRNPSESKFLQALVAISTALARQVGRALYFLWPN